MFKILSKGEFPDRPDTLLHLQVSDRFMKFKEYFEEEQAREEQESEGNAQNNESSDNSNSSDNSGLNLPNESTSDSVSCSSDDTLLTMESNVTYSYQDMIRMMNNKEKRKSQQIKQEEVAVQEANSN